MAAIRVDDPVYEASASVEESRRDEGSLLFLPTPKSRLISTRTVQWTKTKMPATSVGEALYNLKGEFARLEQGIRVLKVTTAGKLVKRVLTISADRFALFVTHQPIPAGSNKEFTAAKSLKLPFISSKGFRGFGKGGSQLRSEYLRHIDVADIDGLQIGVVATRKLEYARYKVNRLKGEDGEIDEKANQIVSILYSGKETLDILVPDKSDRQALAQCIRMMRQTYLAAQKHVGNEDLLLRYIWYDVDTNQDGLIGKKEFCKILTRINFYVSNPEVKFNEFVKKMGSEVKNRALTYPQVMTLLQRLKTYNEQKETPAQKIWNEVFGEDKPSVKVDEFLKKFLHKVQGMTYLTVQDAQEILMAINHMEINHEGAHSIPNLRPNKELTPARFEAFLFDAMNDAYDPWALRPTGSLDHPMSQYWINTSHNTYLTGDQLQSTSSVSMYMLALRRGCKCLELDVWDGETSKDGEPLPVVFHGHTLTSKILFKDILRGVRSYMISNPDTYPVILSLENHCSHPFQKAMAKNLMDILNEFLHVPSESERNEELPSPEKLKGMVVIKGKRPPEPDEDPKENKPGDVGDEEEAPGKKPKIVPELANLTLFHGVKFKNFKSSLKEPPTHMHSIGETKIGKIISKQAANTTLWRQYNTHHMTRTYPAGSRVDSSNYNPTTAWAVGCQMVALNFQTSDAPLILNDGRFRADRRCGYILKPKALLDEGIQRDEDDFIVEQPSMDIPKATPKEEEGAFDFMMGNLEEILCGERTPSLAEHELLAEQPRVQRALVMQRIRTYQQNATNHVNEMRLRIRVVAASCLPKPKGEKKGEHIDPYVTVTLHDVKERGDGKATFLSANFKTDAVIDNGFCPVWKEKAFKEFTVVQPKVAMLQFNVMESDVGYDDFIADTAIPCHRLRTGYRSIQLYDRYNTRTGPFAFAKLLVQFQVV